MTELHAEEEKHSFRRLGKHQRLPGDLRLLFRIPRDAPRQSISGRQRFRQRDIPVLVDGGGLTKPGEELFVMRDNDELEVRMALALVDNAGT